MIWNWLRGKSNKTIAARKQLSAKAMAKRFRPQFEGLEERVVMDADLSIVMSDAPDPVLPGQVLTYNINITNQPPSQGPHTAALDTIASQALPNNVTFLNATSSQGSFSLSGSTVMFSLGTLAPNATASLTVEVSPTSAAAGTTITTVATTSTSSTDPFASNNTTGASTTVSQPPTNSANLAVSQTGQPSAVFPGQNITYNVSVANNGAVAATDSVVVDTLPETTTFVSASAPNGVTVTPGNGIVTFNLGTLGVGSTVLLSVVVQATAPGTVTNTATATTSAGESDTTNNTSVLDTTVDSFPNSADLSVSLSATPNPALPGQALVFSSTVTNNGPNTATNTSFTQSLPGNALFVAASVPAGATYTISNGMLTTNLGSLGSGASASVTLTLTPTGAGSVSSTASASSSIGDNNTANNSATQAVAVDTPSSPANLSVTFADNPDPVLAGQILTYTITVTNTGSVAAANTVLTQVLPSSVVFLSAVGPVGSTTTQVGGVVTCNMGTLAAGFATTITIQATPLAPGSITATATATTSSGDSNTSNNTATTTTTVNSASTGAADLAVSVSDSPDPVVVGQLVTYTAIVVNNADNAASSVALTNILPAGMVFVAATGPAGSSLSQSQGSVTAFLGTLAGRANATLTVLATATVTGTLTNAAVATTSSGDLNPGNNQSTTTTQVLSPVSPANLSVTMLDAPDPAVIGQPLTYTITVSNDGSNPADSTSLITVLPPNTIFVAASGPAGSSFVQNGNVITGQLGNLASNSTAVVMISVLPTQAGTILATTTATTSSGDSSTANNSITAETVVNPAPNNVADLAVSMSGGPSTASPGQIFTYSITVANLSNNVATSSVLTDTLPSNAVFLSANGPAGVTFSLANGVLTANMGNIAAQGVVNLAISVMPVAVGSITNAAVVSTTAGESNTNNNTAALTTPVTASSSSATDLQISATANPSPLATGQILTYTFTIKNNGPNNSPLTTFTDQLGSGVALLSVSAPPGSNTIVNGNNIAVTLGALASGASTTVTIQVTPTATGTILNTASVATSASDTNTSNNTVIISANATSPSAGTDLALTMTGTPDKVVVGQNITYTIVVTNNGPNTSSATNLNNLLPQGLKFVSASGPSGSNFTLVGNSVSGSLGSLAVNSSATITIVATPTVVGSVANSAIVTTSVGDTNTTNNQATVATQVLQAETQTALAATPNPAQAGQPVTLTATIAAKAPGAGTPTGTVTFRDGGLALGSAALNSSGVAVFTVSTLGVGSHNLTAVYNGDAGYSGSTSATVVEVINAALPGTTTIMTVTPNTAVYNAVLTFTAVVTPLSVGGPVPTGQVVFQDGAIVLGSAMLNASGVATFGTPVLSIGSHQLTATYVSNGVYAGSTSSQVSETILPGGASSQTTPVSGWVAQAYRDLLHREAVANDLTYWVNVLALGQTRSQVVAAIQSSLEAHTLVVQELFQEILGRAADQAGLAAGTAFLALPGATTEGFASILYGSAEYFGKSGSTNTSYIQAVYQSVLRRSPLAGETQYWLSYLAAPGSSRQAMALEILLSQESDTLRVGEFYLEYLRRDADAAGLGFFATAMVQGATGDQVIQQLVGAPEYVNLANKGLYPRFVSHLYGDLLKRQATANDLTYWTNVLNAGATSFQVALSITSSPEYRTLQIQQYYATYLKRPADQAGLDFYLAFLSIGGTFGAVQSSLTGSDEYFTNRGAGTNTGFLSALYLDALKRPIDSASLALYTTALAGGATRTQVATVIFASAEYRTLLINGYYELLLRRPADSAGLAAWLTAFSQGARDEQVTSAIASSDEYFLKLPQT